MDADGTLHTAVLHGATFIAAHNATDIVLARKSAAGKDDVPYNAAVSNISEEADVAAGSVDNDAADGVTVAVEGAAEILIGVADVCADRRVVALARAETLGAVGDVSAQFEELALIGGTAVHVARQQVELRGIEDDVGVIHCVAAARPGADDDAGRKGNILGGHGKTVTLEERTVLCVALEGVALRYGLAIAEGEGAALGVVGHRVDGDAGAALVGGGGVVGGGEGIDVVGAGVDMLQICA